MTSTTFFIGIKLLIFSFLLISTSTLFEWDGYYLFIVVLLTLASILLLVYIFHDLIKWKIYVRFNHFPSHILGICLEFYDLLLHQVIANSQYNDTISVICFSILFSMYILDIFIIKKYMSIRDKLAFIWDKLGLFLIVGVCLWPILFSINLILLSLGLVTIVNTSTPTLFIYTFLPKFTVFKCIFTCVICYVNKEVNLQNFTLSLFSLVFSILSGGISYYYIIPHINIITPLVLTKLGAMVKYSSVLMDGWTKCKYTQMLSEGVFSIFTAVNSVFNWYSPPIQCDSPKAIAELFKELPFAEVNSNYIVIESYTGSNNKSKKQITEEFYARRANFSGYKPKSTIYTVSKVVNTIPTIVDRQDFDVDTGEWDLHTVHEKIHNLMQSPNYNRHWTIDKLFKSEDVKEEFYDLVKYTLWQNKKDVSQTTLAALRYKVWKEISSSNPNPNTIKQPTMLFKELPFAKVKSNHLIGEFYTSTYNKSRIKIVEEFNAYRERISPNAPMSINIRPTIVCREDFDVLSGEWDLHAVHKKIQNIMQSPDYTPNWNIGKLFDSNVVRSKFYKFIKEYPFTNSKQVGQMKLAELNSKIWDEIRPFNPTIVDMGDFDVVSGEWDLHAVHKKIQNIMQSPDYTPNWTIGKLFDSNAVRSKFYKFIKEYSLTNSKQVSSTRLANLRRNIWEVIRPPNPNTIRR